MSAAGKPVRLRLWLLVTAVVILAAAAVTAPRADAAEAKPFGIASFTMQTTEPEEQLRNNGTIRRFVNRPYAFTQAGGHPAALTTTIEFDSETIERINTGGQRTVDTTPTQDPKDIVVDLPPGLLGNPTAVPRCPLSRLFGVGGRCPPDTQVGVVRLVLYGGASESVAPIVNVTPEAGQSAEFGLETAFNISYVLTGHVVRFGSGYGLTVVSNQIPITNLLAAELTFWGVPADPGNGPMRGLVCGQIDEFQTCEGGGAAGTQPAVPFLTMPGDCAVGPEAATVSADSWEEPGHYVQAQAVLPAATGCNRLAFTPGISVQPDTLLADEPIGLGVGIEVPQFEEPERLATPQLRDATITLPQGVSVSPGVVDGIQACEESGPEGINFTGPESEEVGLNGELQLAPGHCPDASTLGTAEAVTPLLSEPVKGHVYLARPGCGGAGQAPCTEADALDGNLYKLYLELGGKGKLGDAGVNIKVPGEVEANPATGQLTTRFLEDPQLPFSELKVQLNGGPRAPLDNPATCGPATTTADFMPWSASGTTPEGVFVAGLPDATPSSFYEVSGCGSPSAFAPGFTAGTVTPQAGQYSAFTLDLTRKDREQYVKGVQVHTPPGLVGMLASVPLCAEPAADTGACPAASQIGTTRVASGAGSHPFEIEGRVYLTGPHDGAPFGLSIVTPAVAGPFNLGLVVVRAAIAVDPITSALTITTDESGPYAIPQILDGVPLRLQRITVNIDRAKFMLNPTDCAAQTISANVSATGDAVAHVASPFAVGACRALAFKPNFTASTSAQTSRRNGASLDVKLAFPKNAVGNQANIAKVKVKLPRQLPSRLSTLQKACVAHTFETDPAACPSGSIVGSATAHTPVLPVPLSGPVYFVSHGGAQFPSLIVVLQGDGVRVNLTGATFISKKGITSSTFRTVPDVPVRSFELRLPRGRDSALAANANLCTRSVVKQRRVKLRRKGHVGSRNGHTLYKTVKVSRQVKRKLLMPTEFVAQNGAVRQQQTQIAVSGCATSGKPSRAKRGVKRARAARIHRGGHARRARDHGKGR